MLALSHCRATSHFIAFRHEPRRQIHALLHQGFGCRHCLLQYLWQHALICCHYRSGEWSEGLAVLQRFRLIIATTPLSTSLPNAWGQQWHKRRAVTAVTVVLGLEGHSHCMHHATLMLQQQDNTKSHCPWTAAYHLRDLGTRLLCNDDAS